jgi:uncharacterized protein (DUF1697 family)
METYISILRGINVSGHKMIKMEALRKMYESLGFKNVKTYIQSGNVIFQATKATTAGLAKEIAKKIQKESGFEVPIIVKEVKELESVFENNPFVNKRREDLAKLHVTFLSEKPEASNIEKINAGNYAPDEFIIENDAVYLFCPNGYGNTKLNNTFFENKLKVTATTRNWKTVTELVNIANEILAS